MNCPLCGIENTDNWPVPVNGEIKDGGCQECWESTQGWMLEEWENDNGNQHNR